MKTVTAVLLLAVLLMVGCTSSQVISTLESVVSAAEVAIPVIGAATNTPPATINLIVTYLQGVSTASGKASVILSGTGTTAEKSALIVQAFAQVAAGMNLPAGTPTEIVTVINAVAQAVVNFLAQFPAGSPPAINITAPDYATLSNLKIRSDANVSKLKGMKK